MPPDPAALGSLGVFDPVAQRFLVHIQQGTAVPTGTRSGLTALGRPVAAIRTVRSRHSWSYFLETWDV